MRFTMLGKIIKDWNKINFTDPKHRLKLIGAMQAFCSLPNTPEYRAALQHFATKGDFPAEILQVLEKFHATSDWDTAFEEIFDIRGFQNTNESGFSILNVQNGLTFAEVKVGNKAKVFKFSGTKTDITFGLYGGGLGWHRTLIDDRQYWTLEDNAIAFRNKAFSSRAQVFYDLIDAVGAGQNIAWQAPEPAALVNTDALYTANRDAQTINLACQTLVTNLKDDGMGVNANTIFILLAPFQLRGRIQRALSLQLQAFSGSSGQFHYNVVPRYTTMLSSATSYYVCFPKGKSKGGYRMDLTLFSQFDQLSYSDTMVGWQRYGGAIGDSEQFQRCATS
jgi:hypothetical protein